MDCMSRRLLPIPIDPSRRHEAVGTLKSTSSLVCPPSLRVLIAIEVDILYLSLLGKGLHSKGGVAKLKPAIEELMEK